MALINKESQAEVADYSKIDEKTAFKPCDFQLVSYEWGVTYSGTLMHDPNNFGGKELNWETMFLLAGESTHLFGLFGQFDGSFMQFLRTQFSHHEWPGIHFWDLIQPFFMFIVGVESSPKIKIQWLLGAGIVSLIIGFSLDAMEITPIIKKSPPPLLYL